MCHARWHTNDKDWQCMIIWINLWHQKDISTSQLYFHCNVKCADTICTSTHAQVIPFKETAITWLIEQGWWRTNDCAALLLSCGWWWRRQHVQQHVWHSAAEGDTRHGFVSFTLFGSGAAAWLRSMQAAQCECPDPRHRRYSVSKTCLFSLVLQGSGHEIFTGQHKACAQKLCRIAW
jgi:hypothetical protein